MKTAGCAAVVLAATTVLAGGAAGQQPSVDFQRRAAAMRAEHERRAAEMRAQHERLTGEFLESHGRSAKQQLDQRRSMTQPVQPFHAAAAPRPEDCWRTYVAAARRATSMEQLLGYLPQAAQRQLQERQARYDPQRAAESRERRREQNPQISERALTFLSNSPYVNELAFHKSKANKFLDVLSVKIEGNKAFVEISTTNGATINGVKYPYSTATVEMIGEGSTWKVGHYDFSEVVYLDPPQAKN